MNQLKNLAFKSLIFGLSFLFAGNLFASATNTIKIEIDANQKSIVLSFKPTKNNNVLIQIMDDNEAILHTEQVATRNVFTKKFNLKNLPEGKYYVKVSDEIKDVIQPIEVLVSKIVLDPSARTEIYKPVYRFQNNKLDINLLVLNNVKIDVEIFDLQNQLIFSQTFENVDKHFGERFDLSKLANGRYEIKLSAGNYIYHKSVEVK